MNLPVYYVKNVCMHKCNLSSWRCRKTVNYFRRMNVNIFLPKVLYSLPPKGWKVGVILYFVWTFRCETNVCSNDDWQTTECICIISIGRVVHCLQVFVLPIFWYEESVGKYEVVNTSNTLWSIPCLVALLENLSRFLSFVNFLSWCDGPTLSQRSKLTKVQCMPILTLKGLQHLDDPYKRRSSCLVPVHITWSMIVSPRGNSFSTRLHYHLVKITYTSKGLIWHLDRVMQFSCTWCML